MPIALNHKIAKRFRGHAGAKKSLLTSHGHVLMKDSFALEDRGDLGDLLLFRQFGHSQQILPYLILRLN